VLKQNNAPFIRLTKVVRAKCGDEGDVSRVLCCSDSTESGVGLRWAGEVESFESPISLSTKSVIGVVVIVVRSDMNGLSITSNIRLAA
jgi:hypothetical protein